jgi:hypothetical protein
MRDEWNTPEEERKTIEVESRAVVEAINEALKGKSLMVGRGAVIALGGMYIHMIPEAMRMFAMGEMTTQILKGAAVLDEGVDKAPEAS